MICKTVQFYEMKSNNRGGANLDPVDAAARGEVDRAQEAGTVDLTSGETDDKR
jgi:hypothetical protein